MKCPDCGDVTPVKVQGYHIIQKGQRKKFEILACPECNQAMGDETPIE